MPAARTAINFSSDLLKNYTYSTPRFPIGPPYKDFPSSTFQIMRVFLSSSPPNEARYSSFLEKESDYIRTL